MKKERFVLDPNLMEIIMVVFDTMIVTFKSLEQRLDQLIIGSFKVIGIQI